MLLIAELAKAIQHEDLVEDTLFQAKSYKQMGVVHELDKNFDAAIVSYKKAIELKEKDEDMNTLSLRLSLGDCLFQTKRDAQASLEYKKVLDRCQELKLPQHQEVHLRAIESLAKVLEREEKFASAKQMYQTVCAIREHILGKENKLTKEMYNKVGDLMRQLGQHDEARQEYGKLQVSTVYRDLDGCLSIISLMHSYLTKLWRSRRRLSLFLCTLNGFVN